MRYVTTFFALLTLASAVAAQDAVTENITLQFVRPSQMVEVLTTGKTLPSPSDNRPAEPLLRPGVERVSPNDPEMTLLLRGTAAAIEETKAVIRLLDVKPHEARLRMRLLRYHFPREGGEPRIEELSTMAVQAASNAPVTLTTVGERQVFRIRLQTRINGDESVTVSGELQTADPRGSVPPFDQRNRSTRRILKGETGVILIGSRPDDPQPTEEIEVEGRSVPRTGAASDLYLEITPTVLPVSVPEAAPAKRQ